MNKNDCTIRLEKIEERFEIEQLVRDAFWNVYRSGCLEHYLLHCLRNDPAFVPELNLVLERDGRAIGQCVFTRAEISADDGRKIPIMTMGPICIAPEFQKKGYGKLLLDSALKRAAELGCGAVCFEGDIGFYGHSGFTYGKSFGLRYRGIPDGEDASFFLCKELIPGYLDGVSGEYCPPSVYFVDESSAEEYDKAFPPREKLKLPGQIFTS